MVAENGFLLSCCAVQSGRKFTNVPKVPAASIRAMMEAASTFETSVKYQTARRNNSEHSHLRTRRRENLKISHSCY
jgi:hypothetical protein